MQTSVFSNRSQTPDARLQNLLRSTEAQQQLKCIWCLWNFTTWIWSVFSQVKVLNEVTVVLYVIMSSSVSDSLLYLLPASVYLRVIYHTITTQFPHREEKNGVIFQIPVSCARWGLDHHQPSMLSTHLCRFPTRPGKPWSLNTILFFLGTVFTGTIFPHHLHAEV